MKNNLLDEAIRLAYDKHEGHPMYKKGYCLYSFVVERNKILGYGVNNRDFHVKIHYGFGKRQKGWGNFVAAEHAELSAWRRCRGLIKNNFDLINIRIMDNGNMGMSCPCSCCKEWISANYCKSVYFTTGVGWAKIAF